MAFGGTLYQDIPASFPDSSLTHTQTGIHFATDHEVSFTPGSRLHDLFGGTIAINSRHHQSILEPGRELRSRPRHQTAWLRGQNMKACPLTWCNGIRN